VDVGILRGAVEFVVTVAGSSVSVWEALAGRAPGRPVAQADAGLWAAVSQRLNPARARPVLRAGVETVELTSVRGEPYAMLRSPDRRDGCYLRLTAEERALAELMDGTRTVARLVAEFARISGRLAPDQVTGSSPTSRRTGCSTNSRSTRLARCSG
jgi:putative peptide zinc metalloprotease protein